MATTRLRQQQRRRRGGGGGGPFGVRARMLPLLLLLISLVAVNAFIIAPSSSPSHPTGARPPQTPTTPTTVAAATTSSFAPTTAIPGIAIRELAVNELRAAARVCIYAFFDAEPGKLVTNPIKSMQLSSLEDEQLRDLRGRFGGRRLGKSVMLKAVDEANGGLMVGFVELRVRTDLKYGMGPGVKPKDERPYLANLAVLPSARRKGIGRALVAAGEALVRSWGYDELILQVEDTNAGARKLYRNMGYADVYADPAGRKYVLEGMSIKSVRIRKIGMRKPLTGAGALGAGGGGLGSFFGSFWKK